MSNKKSNKIKCFLLIIVIITIMSSILSGCSKKDDDKVIIYTSLEDYRVEYLQKRLTEEFPNYNIIIEYLSTGNHAAKLVAEGTSTEADITYNLEYGYLEQLTEKGVLADLSGYDFSVYTEDAIINEQILPQERNGGSIIINLDVIKEKNLTIPKSYEDLLKPEYKNLISMPNPKSSGTGYMFLKSLVNAWGEDKAFEYFDKLTENILQYTSSGSGPVNALVQGEAAIGIGMTAQAVTKINEGANFEILFFEEGSPYSMYGQAIIKGKEEKKAVQEVFDFLYLTFTYENSELFYPEQIFKDKTYEIENYPTNINYADMNNNTIEEKERLLNMWKY